MNKRWLIGGAAAAVEICISGAGHAQTVGTTDFRGAMVGAYAASQMGINLYGTDLGIPVGYGGTLRVLFGDSWKDSNGDGLGGAANSDDCQGGISLAGFPNGDAVDTWLNDGSRKQVPQWRTDGPTLTMRTNAFGSVAPLAVYDGNTTLLDMGLGRTPTAAFANKAASGGGVFAFFGRQVGLLCTTPTSCGTGFACDQGMGTCGGASTENAIACVIGTTRCGILGCSKPSGYVGVCQDQTSSVYDGATEDGRILASVLKERVGNADPTIFEIYYTQQFVTNKFINVTTRTVRDFLPTRPYNSTANVFSPGTGATGGNEKVFLWGRPNFAGYGHATGKSDKVYLAYVDMPTYSSTGTFAFAPKYFSGYGASGCTTGQPAPDASHMYPCFAATQNLALPLNLGATGDNTVEVKDIVQQHAVSWVPALAKFVMIYGGDGPDAFFSLDVGPNYGTLQHDPNGSMFFRYATYPWGPWSSPATIAVAGTYNPATNQYASGGALYSPYCTGTCASLDSHYTFYGDGDKVGRLYGASIVDEWTMTRGTNTADIYWFASTWDPYEVLTMRTRINP
jgi:hypothetical protein